MGRFAATNGYSNDWTGAKPQKHTEKELADIKDYAGTKGIKIYNVNTFDGDMDMLKEQIDVIDKMKQEYGINQKITIRFDSLPDDDFADSKDYVIRFNKKALRNREITEKNLQADNFLAANYAGGISAHEMGHIISAKYGEKGLDIAAQAYYNIYKETPTRDEMLDYLTINVSTYSDSYKGKQVGRDIPAHKRVYNEITPEVLSQNMYGTETDFSTEFVRLLKERCSV